jgi:hypothetical protein
MKEVFLLNIHGVNNIRQTEIRTAAPLVRERSSLEAGIANEKLKRYKSPGAGQFPVECM